MVGNSQRLSSVASTLLLIGTAALTTGATRCYHDPRALIFDTWPKLTVAPNASVPLAARVECKTIRATRFTLEATSADHSFSVEFDEFQHEHSHPIVGFRPDRTYSLQLILADERGEQLIRDLPDVQTDPLPASFPTIELLSSNPALMAPGVTLFDAQSTGGGEGYYVIVDANGEVIWYYDTPNNAEDIRRLPNGNFLHNANFRIREVDLLGNEIRQWGNAATASGDTIPVVLPAGALRFGHHESFAMPSGNILTYFSQIRSVENYPTSETDPAAPTATSNVLDDVVVEFEPTGVVVNQWSLLDMLDPTRIGYNSVNSKISGAADWAHTNAVIYDESDDAIIVSARHQDAVVKFSRATGDALWILGTHANWLPPFDALLLTPVGSPFEWPYHQHAPMILPGGKLLLFDNGNNRASPFDPPLAPLYSRAVEYAIDEVAGEISQVWEYGSSITPLLYASFVGDADALGNDDVLITFGGLSSAGRNVARIIEVDRSDPAQVVFDLSVTNPTAMNGVRVYRSERLPGLYP